jgi:hypothetical protein
MISILSSWELCIPIKTKQHKYMLLILNLNWLDPKFFIYSPFNSLNVSFLPTSVVDELYYFLEILAPNVIVWNLRLLIDLKLSIYKRKKHNQE